MSFTVSTYTSVHASDFLDPFLIIFLLPVLLYAYIFSSYLHSPQFTHNPFRHDDRRGDDEIIDFVNPVSRTDANGDRHLDIDRCGK